MSSTTYGRGRLARGSMPTGMLGVLLLCGLFHSTLALSLCAVGKTMDTVLGVCVTNLCPNTPCGHGTCKMANGLAVCTCEAGYRNDPLNPARKCAVCDLGYGPGELFDAMCFDNNECASPITACGAGVKQCNNTMGSYQCSCKTGYKLSNILRPDGSVGPYCINVNECTGPDAVPGACATNTLIPACTDVTGTYSCNCKPGFVESANYRGVKDCVDKNECALNSALCANGACKNTIGGYTCDCNAGFELKYTLTGVPYCREIDECYRFKGVAGFCENAYNCTNSPLGSYRCNCKPGYTQVTNATTGFKTCVDINECNGLLGLGTCGAYANSCVNTAGSYYCKCKTGFQEVNKRCVDFNECWYNSGMGSCGANATSCSNTVGNYTCVCKRGYREVGTYPNKRCIDIDECAANPSRCGAGGVCTNTPGSWKCTCPTAPVKYVSYVPPLASGPYCLEDKCAPNGGTHPCVYGTCYPTAYSIWKYDCDCPYQKIDATSTSGPTCHKPVA